MKKGFTLIELLAVITILAIIALIAVPILIHVINETKLKSQKNSIDLYGRAVDQAISRYTMETNDIPEGSFTTTDGKKLIQNDIVIDVEFKGDVVCKDIVIDSNQNVFLDSCAVNKEKVNYSVGKLKNNILAERKTYEQDGVIQTSDNFLTTEVDATKISKFYINTKGTEIPNGYSSSDCSYNQDKSVMCYWKEDFVKDNNTYYEMTIAANGEIYTPKNSLGLFDKLGYDELEELNLNGLNTKYTENMQTMFDETGYTAMTILDLGDKFDTSKVTNMYCMFYKTGYTAMTKLDLGDKFDTSDVTNMAGMFNETGYNSMTTLNLGDKFDTINVINMSGMFQSVGYTKLKSLNLGNKFDTSKVTNMSYMFNEAGYTSLESLDLEDKFDTSNVTNMLQMFSLTGYTAMTRLDLGEKFNTSKVTNMYAMFDETGYTAMASLDLGDKFDTSNVTNMEAMFYFTGYTKMTALNLGNKFDTSKITNMTYMFYATGYNKMTTLNLGSKFVIPTSASIDLMFGYCGKSGVLTKVIVPNEALKTKILGLGNNNVPSWWNTNNIIEVQTN